MNFFKPKGRGDSRNKMAKSNLFSFSGRKQITWDSAKAVAFSSSSESDVDASTFKQISGTKREGTNALWLAAAGKSYTNNLQNIFSNREGAPSGSDEGDLWATAAASAQYADCDKTTSVDDSQELWAAAADPAAYEDCDNSMHNNNSRDDTQNSLESVMIFDPPAILGHHNDQPTTNPNTTIL